MLANLNNIKESITHIISSIEQPNTTRESNKIP